MYVKGKFYAKNNIFTIAAMMGMRMVHVAELLVTSVSRATREQTIMSMSQPGRLPKTDNWSPIHWDNPDT